MRTDISKINEQTPHQDLTEGLMLFAGGTSKQFHTGEWRTRTPILDRIFADNVWSVPWSVQTLVFL